MDDVVIVGAGLCGSWAARTLSQRGLKTVVLEAGPPISLDSIQAGARLPQKEREFIAGRQPIQSQHRAYWLNNPAHFVDDLEHPYTTPADAPFTWIRGRQVGGRSLTWGGVTLRVSDIDLAAADRDGFGAAWPIRYRDLADSYERVERFLQVCGSTEAIESLPDGAFVAPAPMTDSEKHFKSTVESHWPKRRVIPCRAVEEPHTPGGTQPEEWPRRSAQYRMWPEAMGTGCTQLRSNTIARSLIADRHTNRVLGVACIDRLTGESFEVRGKTLLLCASALESVRLLLNSGDDRWPAGLANSSGALGRFLVDHGATWAVGPTSQPAPSHPVPMGGAHGILIPRFRNVYDRAQSFLRGYGIWGSAGRAEWRHTGRGLWTLCAMIEVLPRPDNLMRIDRDRTDKWGIPVPFIDLTYSANEREMLSDAESAIGAMIERSGWQIGDRGRTAPGGFVHELGGARMGDSPASSVLNANNQAWDIPNLFVLDGACFVTAPWQNPALTILAVADRACGFIAQELEQGHL